MTFIRVIAKALRRRSNIFTNKLFRVIPSRIESILCSFRVIFFVILKLFFGHHKTTIITNQITVLNVLIDMLCILMLIFPES